MAICRYWRCKMMKDAFPDSDAESEKHRAEEPKTYQTDW